MTYSMPIAMGLHLLAAVVWVGGMFFAYIVLRPVVAGLLQPPARLPLWNRCFARFFPWVWIAVLLLPGTGYWIIFKIYGGPGHTGLHVLLMQLIGIPMILLFLHVYFAPYRRLNIAVSRQDWPRAGKELAVIRRLIGINLLLGLSLVVIGTAGRFL